jgi:hypothetical protein
MIFALSANAVAGTLSIRILDETGAPTPARVYLTDDQGKAVFAPGTIQYHKEDKGIQEQYCIPLAGALHYLPGPGLYSLQIEKGKEYLPLKVSLKMPASGDVDKVFHLKRWCRMASQGWFSGDMQVHAPMRIMATLLKAEDLNVALPITVLHLGEGAEKRDLNLQFFLDKADSRGVVAVTKSRLFTVLNEELESPASSVLASRVGRNIIALQYPLPAFARTARERGALVDCEKATSLELPVVVASGGCNFLELANNGFWRAGWANIPWGTWPDLLPRRYPGTAEGFAQATFDIYYALLNSGFPLKISAGSANGVDPVPVGWSRVYVHVKGDFSAEKWFAALEEGRSFVTTGPMLLLTANGLEPGQQSKGEHFPLEVNVDLKMLSPTPVDQAEVVLNGSVHPVAMKPGKSEFTYQGNLRLSLQTSSWLAARWIRKEGENADVAHTSPIYFWNGESPIPISRPGAEYLAGRISAMTQEVMTGKSESGQGPVPIAVDNPALREQTLKYLDQAKQIFQKKIQEAP